MDPQRLSRRAFLAGAAATVATGAVATLGAPLVGSPLLGVAGAAPRKRITPLVLSSDLFASPDPQRFVFAVAKTKGAAANGPIKYASGDDARVGFAPSGANVTELVDATLHT